MSIFLAAFHPAPGETRAVIRRGALSAVFLFSVCSKRAIGARRDVDAGKNNFTPQVCGAWKKRPSMFAFISFQLRALGQIVLDESVSMTVACRVLAAGLMIIEVTYSDSQEFDDGHSFQWLAFIDICCEPPAKR